MEPRGPSPCKDEYTRRYLKSVPTQPRSTSNPITEGDASYNRPTRGCGEQKVSNNYKEENDKRYLRPADRGNSQQSPRRYIAMRVS